MPVSQKQIAELIGIDRSMVSHALRGDQRVAEPTRLRVLDAARELGYHDGSNQGAREMAARRYGKHLETRVIGFVYDGSSVDDYYGAGIYRGMQDAAGQHDYDLLNLIRVREGWKPENEGLQYLDRRTDGLIFFVPHGRDELLSTLVKHRVPVATIGMKAAPGVAHIKTDNIGMARTAVEYLAHRGHTKIAHLTGPQGHGDYDERRAAFLAAMKTAGLSTPAMRVAYGIAREDPWEIDFCAIRALLQSDATAIICGNDQLALAVWEIAEEQGKQIPRDLSIFGMDDMPGAAERGLTTLRFALPTMGRAALDAVVRIIGGARPEECGAIIPAELIERASVAPPHISQIETASQRRNS